MKVRIESGNSTEGSFHAAGYAVTRITTTVTLQCFSTVNSFEEITYYVITVCLRLPVKLEVFSVLFSSSLCEAVSSN